MPRGELTVDNPFRDHPDPGDDAHRHPGAAALGERKAAHGTIKSISGTSFVLTTEEADLTVLTSADTNYHGLSRRQAREAGYQDIAIVNTFAALRVGQRVGAMGERKNDTALHATRVHISEP